MNKKGQVGGIVIIIIILLIVGIYGGYQTGQKYYTCDIGIDGSFCVYWHKTEVGKMVEWMNDMDTFGEDLMNG